MTRQRSHALALRLQCAPDSLRPQLPSSCVLQLQRGRVVTRARDDAQQLRGQRRGRDGRHSFRRCGSPRSFCTHGCSDSHRPTPREVRTRGRRSPWPCVLKPAAISAAISVAFFATATARCASKTGSRGVFAAFFFSRWCRDSPRTLSRWFSRRCARARGARGVPPRARRAHMASHLARSLSPSRGSPRGTSLSFSLRNAR